jgi:hypothetical protein
MKKANGSIQAAAVSEIVTCPLEDDMNQSSTMAINTSPSRRRRLFLKVSVFGIVVWMATSRLFRGKESAVVQRVPIDDVKRVPVDVVKRVPVDVVKRVPVDVAKKDPTDVVEKNPVDVVRPSSAEFSRSRVEALSSIGSVAASCGSSCCGVISIEHPPPLLLVIKIGPQRESFKTLRHGGICDPGDLPTGPAGVLQGEEESAGAHCRGNDAPVAEPEFLCEEEGPFHPCGK